MIRPLQIQRLKIVVFFIYTKRKKEKFPQNMPSLMSVKLTYQSSGGFDEGSVHAVHLVIETTGVT